MKRHSHQAGARHALIALALPLSLAISAALAQSPAAAQLDPVPVGEAIRADDGLMDFRQRPIEVFVRLDEPSVAEFVAAGLAGGARPNSGQQRGHARKLEVQQSGLRRQLEAMGVEVRHSLRAAANGLHVSATPGQIRQILGMPGVQSVHSIELHEPLNADSVPWIGAPDAWVDPGARGEGVVIGVIDTGIDYFHAGHGGSGDPGDFAANDPTTLDDISAGQFPNAKVIGGHDFVGSDFDAGDPANNTPMPDDDPVDENFHGTHVSGSAAGLPTGFVGSGVAPGASLYALKVFGISGSTNQTANAIERALDPD